jgi:type I restriction enzyme S subunit
MQKLGEIASVKGGKRLPKGETLTTDPNSHPYIRTKDIENHVIKTDQLEYIPDAVQKKIARYIVDAGDLVVSIVGTVGSCAIVPAELHRANLTENCAKILLNTEDYTTHFLYYFLRSPEGQQEIFKNTVGSTQLKLPLYGIENIDLPSLTVTNQKAIAHILGTLDDKIELNQKMNQTLEEIAKAIFKSWFVDFGPVRAKAEGRPTGLPPEISDLFPDELVDSEIGEIPKGWSVGAISDFAFLNKKNVNPSQSSQMYEHFSIPAFDSGQSPALDLGIDIKSNKTLVVEGSLLVSKLNPNTPRVWLPNPKELHEQICSTEFMVYTATDRSNTAYLWGLFTGSAVTKRMEAMVTGTSKSHQRVKPNDVSRINTVIPDTRLIEQYGEMVLLMLNRTLVGKSESTVISELRDTLLPKLISGELRIPDAEKFLEEAGI